MAVNNIDSLIKRLEKCCCEKINYREDSNKWYIVELIYNKKYHRFFALTFKQLEQQSLHDMRRINWRKWYEYESETYSA